MMLQASAHRDVLEAPIPDSDASRRGLLEELKNRGRSAVAGKAWPDAQLLYEKALKVADAMDASSSGNERAILHSNLSLVLAKMGKFGEAKQAALHATQKDETYVKGWWRLGQAMASLKDYKGAVEVMEKARVLDPDNKALTKECEKLRQEAAKAPVVKEEEEKKGPKTEPAPPRSDIYKATPAAPKESKNGNTTNGSEDVVMADVDVDEEDKNLFTKSEPVRGYKIVNGKKTSYFHNELSEEAKQLIGDIAPKKLDATAAPTPQPTNGDNKSATSVWNQAGTWEERDVSAWAKEALTHLLMLTTYSFPDSSPAPGALARIEKVKKLDGHASFATVRGKKKYIYEYKIDLEWVLDLPGETDAVKGKISFPDVDGTCELGEGYDISNFEITSIDDHALRPVLDRFIKSSGLRESLHESIDDWVRQFREKY